MLLYMAEITNLTYLNFMHVIWIVHQIIYCCVLFFHPPA